MDDTKPLKDAGLKVTFPRLKILELLESSAHHHMSAEEIHHQLSLQGQDIGLATVYRVLSQFEAAGLVVRHHFEGNSCVFELSQSEHHDHLVCIKCALIEEFMDQVIEMRQSDIALRAGFHMTDHALTIYGLCQRCQLKT